MNKQEIESIVFMTPDKAEEFRRNHEETKGKYVVEKQTKDGTFRLKLYSR